MTMLREDDASCSPKHEACHLVRGGRIVCAIMVAGRICLVHYKKNIVRYNKHVVGQLLPLSNIDTRLQMLHKGMMVMVTFAAEWCPPPPLPSPPSPPPPQPNPPPPRCLPSPDAPTLTHATRPAPHHRHCAQHREKKSTACTCATSTRHVLY